jgi:hypothetical protein
MPSWYPIVRAVRYYNGAYTIEELAARPFALIQWALTAEAAENIGEQIARDLQKHRE